MKLSRYCVIYPDLTDPDSVILYSTKRASAVKLDKSTLDGINNGSIPDEDKLTLIDLGLVVNSDEEEKNEMLNYFDELNAMDTRLSVVIAMNLDCNLACPYCFEGSRRGKHYMSEQAAEEVIRFIDNRLNGIEELRVSFYGGEPLLSSELVLNMSKRLHAICTEKGIKFATSMTTNGTLLTPEIIGRLKPYGLESAFITIDGPEEIHNVSRPFATGKGSFAPIIENIKAVCKLINIEISGNFSPANYMHFPLLLDQLIERGITPDKVNSVKFDPVLRERDGIVLPDYNGGCRSINEPWLFEAWIYLRTEILRRGFASADVAPSLCAMERDRFFIISYDGSLCKCPGLIGQPDYGVGNVVTGVCDYRASHHPDTWKNDECLGCAYLPLCFGGCRYMNLLREGSMADLDCRKPYYDACLEQLVRQDLGE
jgi:uncharacterized protein